VRIVVLLAALLVVAGASRHPLAQSADDQAHQQWLEERYKEATSIQPGMTRADLLKLFFQEGGFQGGRLQTAQARYVLKSCPLIHIDVTFDRASGGLSKSNLDGEVKIVAISKPYLARLVID
jgi:hypothetical protein